MNTELEERKTLKHNGWNVTKASRYNSGSETVVHSVAKTVVGHYLSHELGYRVAFEVEQEDSGNTVDVLAWGQPDRISPLAVELETDYSPEVGSKKIMQYVDGQPIQECYFIDPLEMPEEIMPAYEWVSERL